MAPKAGLEPATYRLTAGCSAIELFGIIGNSDMKYGTRSYYECQALFLEEN
jgi:hypothetical protein